MNELSYLQIAILALIQGAAELLPVSSSAHVILAERLMDLDPSKPEMTFLLVMLHTGTMFAVLVYFWKRWRNLLIADKTAGTSLHFPKMIVLATIASAVVFLGFKFLIEKVILERALGHEKGEVEHLFRNLYLIATALFLVGLFIIVAGTREAKAEVNVLTPASSVWIGLIQGVCLPFRGFSRSGATISMALCRGVARPLAEDFSFALAVVLTPPAIAYEFYRLLEKKHWDLSDLGGMVLPGVVGMIFSFIAGLVALYFLSAALEAGRWKFFGYYCLGASAVMVAAATKLGT